MRAVLHRVATHVATLALCAASQAASQVPAPEVGASFGVDTSDADVGPIVRLVRAYMTSRDPGVRSHGLWRQTNGRDHTQRDLAGRYARQGFPANVVGVTPTDAGDSVYVVKVLHGRADHARGPVSAMALERLYAVRAPTSPFGWQLTAALPRLTNGWTTHTSGRITFHYEPGQLPVAAKAAAAGRFVDSVAALWAVSPPARIHYYVTASPDAYFRALGLDFYVLPSGRGEASGGNSLPDAGIVLAGDPAQAEGYRHELTHVALGSRVRSGFINEGIAAWLGGSRRQNPRQLFRNLGAFQRAHPELTLSRVMGDKLSVPHDPARSSDAWYASGALVCEMVYRRAGVEGLRALADTPRDVAGAEGVIAHLLGISERGALDRWWRSSAALAATASVK